MWFNQHQGDRQLEFSADDISAQNIFKNADDEAPQHGTARAVNAADQGRGKGIQQDAGHHIGLQKHHRRNHHAGDRANGRGQPPAQSQHPTHPNAHQTAGVGVLRSGPHGQTQGGEFEEPIQHHQQHQRHTDRAQFVRRNKVQPEGGLFGKGRWKGFDGVGKDPTGDAVENHQQANEDHHHVQYGGFFNGLDDDALNQHPQREGQQNRADKSQPIRHAGVDECPGHVGGEHGNFALGEVDVVGGLVDHDQGQRQAGINPACRDAGNDLVNEGFHGVGLSMTEVRATNGFVLLEVF